MTLMWNSWMLFQCLYCWHKRDICPHVGFFNCQMKKSLHPHSLYKERIKTQTFWFDFAIPKKMWQGLLKPFIRLSETFQIEFTDKYPNFYFYHKKAFLRSLMLTLQKFEQKLDQKIWKTTQDTPLKLYITLRILKANNTFKENSNILKNYEYQSFQSLYMKSSISWRY